MSKTNGGGVDDAVDKAREPAEAAWLAEAEARREAFVEAEFVLYAPRLGDDPRREDLFRENARVRWLLMEAAHADKDRAIACQKIADSLLKGIEQKARLVRLDLKTPFESRKLTTATAVLEYMDTCREVLESAENRLRTDAPDEFQRLQKMLAQRQNPAKAETQTPNGPPKPTSLL